jgi:heme-degrading monooxygenase HmoA
LNRQLTQLSKNLIEKKIMIERHWRGIAQTEKAHYYISFFKHVTFKYLSSFDGFISGRVLMRARSNGMEFFVISRWETCEALKKFAGADLDKALVPDYIRQGMTEYTETVEDFEVMYLTDNE